MRSKLQMRRLATGQALAETVIAALFVLVPIFVLVPLLGKYLNLSARTTEAARYAAFQRTVWSASGSRDGSSVAQASNAHVAAETADRMFSTAGGAIQSLTAGAGSYQARNLWVDQSGKTLLASYNSVQLTLSDAAAPGPSTAALSTAMTLLRPAVKGALPLNFNGLFTAAVQATAQAVVFPAPLSQASLVFNAQDTLLADGWDAASSNAVLSTVQAQLGNLDWLATSSASQSAVVAPDLSGLQPGILLTNNAGELPADRLGPP